MAVEREALAIKWAVAELRYYIAGHHFTLVINHALLQWMVTAKDINAPITCWFSFLQDFSFEVQHRSGTQLRNANGLSRSYSLCAEPWRAVGLELKGGCESGQRKLPQK